MSNDAAVRFKEFLFLKIGETIDEITSCDGDELERVCERLQSFVDELKKEVLPNAETIKTA